VGSDGLLRPPGAARPVVGGDHPGTGHLRRQPGLQPAGRRAARRGRRTIMTNRGMTDTLLAVRNLSVTYPGDDGDVRAVRNVSFTLGRERLGIVGESGSGKSTTGRAIMGLVGHPGRIEADTLRLGGDDLLRLD